MAECDGCGDTMLHGDRDFCDECEDRWADAKAKEDRQFFGMPGGPDYPRANELVPLRVGDHSQCRPGGCFMGDDCPRRKETESRIDEPEEAD